MATVLASYDFTPQRRTPPTKNQHKYAWDDWFDGQVWKLTRGRDGGADFQPQTLMMERIIRTRASSHNLSVNIRHIDDDTGEHLILKARPLERSTGITPPTATDEVVVADAPAEETIEERVEELVHEAVEEIVEGVTEAIAEMIHPEVPSPPAPVIPEAPTFPTTVTPEGETIQVGDDEPTVEELFEEVSPSFMLTDPTQPEDVPQGDSSFGADIPEIPEPVVSESTGAVIPAAPVPDAESEDAWDEPTAPAIPAPAAPPFIPASPATGGLIPTVPFGETIHPE